MRKMSNQNEETPKQGKDQESLLARIRKALRTKPDTSLREALEEYIEKPLGAAETNNPSITAHERSLLANILKLQDYTVTDVMIPRADIIALEVGTSHEEVLQLLAEKQYSRLPVYRGTLDKVLGTVHIKDMISKLAQNEKIVIKDLIRETMFVSPAMHVLDLLLQMRQSRRHLVMVVDEFGGIDGLVTIGDVIEAIIGEIEDEHETDDGPMLKEDGENAFVVDARMSIESFEERFGHVLSDDEREESDTLGGLIFSIAGRVPARGEVLTHDNGMVFEVLEADPRRVNRVRISSIPTALGKT